MKGNLQLLLEEYYAQNAEKLRNMVDRILRNFGGIAQKDYDDFYSLANEVFVDLLKKYNPSQSFEGFLYTCLANRIKNEIRNRNQIKRRCDRNTISIDMPIDEEGRCIGEFLVSDFDMEQELNRDSHIFVEEKIEKYFASLSKVQKQIMLLRMEGFSKVDIMGELHLSEKIYNKNLNQAKQYDKVKWLIEDCDRKIIQGDKGMIAQTSEISKNTNYSISSYIKKLKNYSIRGDHPLQRNSNQWNNEQRYNLITTVLNKFPIPEVILAEQAKQNGTINWLIDGKQRLTNLSDYKEGIFKVGKNAERPIIKYQTVCKDEKGKILLDQSGSPQYENKEFDIRGKYYQDLPEELQERFNDYTISAVQYLLCSDDDIEYHIRRYNAAKPMSAAQKGITHLGEQYAGVVKKMTQHPFFKDKGNFKISEFSNGTIDRVVTESIMVIYFLDHWKKRQEDICAYLKENVKVKDFDEFENLLNRLNEIVEKENAVLFQSKDAFLWFGLFYRFSRLEFEDEKFMEFMEAFQKELHSKKIKGKSYDDFCTRGTKDKLTVIKKLTVMESLMNQFLHIETEKEEKLYTFLYEDKQMQMFIEEFTKVELIQYIDIRPQEDRARIAIQALMMIAGKKDLSNNKIQDFIVNQERTKESIEDTLLYLSVLSDWSIGVDNNSSIFDKENIPALIKMAGYFCRNDIEEEIAVKWFEHFVGNFEANGGFPKKNQEKYEKMIQSLNRYVAYIRQSRPMI